jgi:hypothetical protein
VWILGLFGTQSERFRKVTLRSEDLKQLTISDTTYRYDGDGRLLRLALQAYALGILIVCPANLSFQWQRELKEKFDEKFLVLKGYDIRDQFGVNQWLEQKKVIMSLDLAKQNDGMASISGDRRIDLAGPGIDSAAQVLDFLEARLTKELERPQAALSVVTVQDNLLTGVELVQTLGQMTEGDQPGTGQACDLVLVRLPHVDQCDLATLERSCQLARFDIEKLVPCRYRSQAAERFVVHQFANRRVLAANGAGRILLEL